MFFDSLTMPERTVERQEATAHSLAQVLGATHDGRASAESARGLLVTVLGEFVRPNGPAWTQTLLEVMEALGVQPKATRQSLARLADNGWLTRTRDGRRTRWHLTDTSRELLDTGAARIYGFGQTSKDWDGRWSVLLASLPDGHPTSRHRLKTRLGWAGYASFEPGAWISPWVDHEGDAVRVLDELGLGGGGPNAATSFVAELGRLGDGRAIARRAWNLTEVDDRYREFVEATAVPDGATGVEAARELTRLVHAWRRFPFLDPELPDELLPDGWLGSAAAQRFTDARSALVGPATDWWLASDARFSI